MRRLAALLVLLATAAPAVADEDLQVFAPAGADACDLAVAALVEMQLSEGEGAVAVSDEVDKAELDAKVQAGAKSAQPGAKGPSAAMAKAYLAAKPVSAVTACPKVRAYLDSQKVGYGRDGVREAQRAAGSDPLGAMVIRLSLPVISPDGREAIMDQTYSFRTGGGGSKTYYWNEPAGPWHSRDLDRWLS